MNTKVAKPGDKIRWLATGMVVEAMPRNMSVYEHWHDLISIYNENLTRIHLKPHEYEIIEEESK
jgi:hypothetical protein